ncbi:MAG: SDR family NAD(P)-dependent oxidoreductase [Planctomycetes bacterium]|nr:SDR family NAD(P)-dependent oxidoreductase [Planctomycetota bacterium]
MNENSTTNTDFVGRALIVGASDGIGAALVRRLVESGYRVAAVARTEQKLTSLASEFPPGRVLAYAHDVRNTNETRGLFDKITAELGGLDMIQFTAGVMPNVREDEYDIEKDREIIDINCAGAAAWLDCAATLFEKQKRGVICGISSIAGDRGRRGNPGYHASKAWLDAFLESLRNRLAKQGVTVVTIKPGYIDTAMTRGRKGLFWMISADECARRILGACRQRATVRYVPMRWFWVGFIIKRVPSFIMTRFGPP